MLDEENAFMKIVKSQSTDVEYITTGIALFFYSPYNVLLNHFRLTFIITFPF